MPQPIFFRLALAGPFLTLSKPPAADQSRHNSSITDAIRGQQLQALARLRIGSVELPQMTVVNAQIEVGYIISGIGLRPKFVDLPGLLPVARDVIVEVGFNIKPFRFA